MCDLDPFSKIQSHNYADECYATCAINNAMGMEPVYRIAGYFRGGKFSRIGLI